MYEFLRDINTMGTTIILTTHYLEEAESLCRNVGIINHGEIIANTSIKELLRGLHREIFILDVRDPLPPDLYVDEFILKKVDEHCLEAEIEQGQDLGSLMSQLHDKKVCIQSMRNRENRLEQMFVSLLERGK